MTDHQRPGHDFAPHEFWQDLHPPGHFPAQAEGYERGYAAALPDGRSVVLPLRVLPGDGRAAVASLILNQASFAVQDALADALVEAVSPFAPEVVVGVPTLGLPLAAGVARRLGHRRMVPLGTTRKFWYRDDLAEPMASITSPDHLRNIYLDPRMLPLLDGRRVALIDDVASTGRTLGAVLRLLERAGIRPVVAGFAMLQGPGWQPRRIGPGIPVAAALATPRFAAGENGLWFPEPE